MEKVPIRHNGSDSHHFIPSWICERNPSLNSPGVGLESGIPYNEKPLNLRLAMWLTLASDMLADVTQAEPWNALI